MISNTINQFRTLLEYERHYPKVQGEYLVSLIRSEFGMFNQSTLVLDARDLEWKGKIQFCKMIK